MATQPTFRLLDRAYLANAGNTLLRNRVSISATGIRLAESSERGSPRSLDSRDGSLGKLGLPLGMAIDAKAIIYLLISEESRIKCFDPTTNMFTYLNGIGGAGTDARRFQGAVNVAIAANDLYVADRGNRRVQVFDLRSRALLHIWDSIDAADVCSADGAAYVLEQEKGRVFRHLPGTDRKRLVVDSPADAARWSRVLVDLQGRLYLFDAAKVSLSIYTSNGSPAGTLTIAGDVRDRFALPPVNLDQHGLFAWAGSAFDLWGRPVAIDPYAPLGAKLYQSKGSWISSVMDSGIYRCPWHRIELDADLPAGTRLVVSTYTDSRPLADQDLPTLDGEWQTCFEATCPGGLSGSTARSIESLIQSQQGRYLWLRLEFESDGFATATVGRVKIHFPRETYLDHLPAIYSGDDQGRRFLENFLSVFKTEWDELEVRNAAITAYFDPTAVSESHIDWLAAWLALSLEESWTAEKKRRLLQAAPKLYPKLGTPHGLREYLRVYLENLGGPLPAQYPIVVEGFRRRRQILSLGNDALGRAGSGASLWSTGVVGRLQIGEYSRVGEARIVSTGDPDTDVFQVYAHRFQVFVPALSVKTSGDERMLRRALDAAKPGHTAYDLILVAPRFRIGVQSSVGMDTVIGTYPSTRLASEGQEDESAPSAPPQNRLGYDTLLAPLDPSEPTFELTRRGARAGVNTILN